MRGQLRHDFHDRLAGIEDTLLTSGDVVLDMLSQVMEALDKQDQRLADVVIATDDRVDEMYFQVEDEVFTVIALQAPVARELRLLQAFVHINVHLERMGDQCVNVAKMVALTSGLESDPELRAQVEEMGAHARRVASACIHALRSRDVDLARSLPELDEPVDRLNKGLFKRLTRLAVDDSRLDWAMRMVLVTRYLERLADHAVDVGEYVIFAETGERLELSSNSPQP